jgi:hypothetical protein
VVADYFQPMSRRRVVILIVLLISLVAGWWLWWSYETPNHRRIRFYGAVVDQNGQPVPQATIYITVLYNSITGAGQKRGVIQSNMDGTFTVSGYKGRTLDIGLRKEGYDYEGDVGPFHYTQLVGPGSFVPNEQAPVKFVMWKRQGAEPMVSHVSVKLELPYDGQEHRLDLLKGCLVPEGGDIVVRLSAPPVTLEETRKRHAWDWDLVLEAEGGFVFSTQKLMSQAPEGGYRPVMNLGRKMTDKIWWDQATGDFYVLSRRKLYSKLHLYFTGNPALGTGGLWLDWKTNPGGSRNLEYDKAKDVTEQYRERKR